MRAAEAVDEELQQGGIAFVDVGGAETRLVVEVNFDSAEALGPLLLYDAPHLVPVLLRHVERRVAAAARAPAPLQVRRQVVVERQLDRAVCGPRAVDVVAVRQVVLQAAVAHYSRTVHDLRSITSAHVARFADHKS